MCTEIVIFVLLIRGKMKNLKAIIFIIFMLSFLLRGYSQENDLTTGSPSKNIKEDSEVVNENPHIIDIKDKTKIPYVYINQVQYNLNNSFFPNDEYGYGVGNYGLILKTSNSGFTWVKQNSNTTKNLNAVFFTDSLNGYIIGESGRVMLTSNGGKSWSRADAGTTNNLLKIYFTDKKQGYITDNKGTIYKTVNGGKTWKVMNNKL